MLRVICDICGKDMTEETQRWIVNRINKKTNHKTMMLLLQEMTKDEFDICPDCLEELKTNIEILQKKHGNIIPTRLVDSFKVKAKR